MESARSLVRSFRSPAWALLVLGCSSATGGGPSAPEIPNAAPQIVRAIPAEAALSSEAGLPLTFEVEAADPEGDPLSFEVLLDGVRVAAANRFNFVPDSAGTHLVTLRVSDGRSFVAREWSVSVTPRVPHPPLATLVVAPDSGTAPLQVAIQASGSDADGSVARVQLDADGDGTYEAEGVGPLAVSARFDAPGTFRVSARVTDDEGLVGLTEHPIRVVANLPPEGTLLVSPAEGPAPLSVRVQALASDPEGAVALYELDAEGDGTFDIAQPIPIDTVLVFVDYTRTHALVLRVTDAAGASAQASASVRPRPDVDPSASQLGQSGSGRLAADGSATRRITVQVVDRAGNPLPQVGVELFSSRNGGAAGTVDRIVPERGNTDGAGIFEADFSTTSSSSLLGDAVVGARADGNPLQGTVTVQFYSVVSSYNSTITCPVTAVHVTGSALQPQAVPVIARVRDAQGNLLSGIYVEMKTRSLAVWPVQPVGGRTDASGEFQASVSATLANDNTFVDLYADGVKTSAICFLTSLP